MIRIAVMMDDAGVIGYANEDENKRKRLPLLPKQLHLAMQQLYKGENIAGGESSWNKPTSQAKNKRYVITRNQNFDTQEENVQIITDAQELIEHYVSSEEELLIVGGLSMFKLFTPHASILQIALSDKLVPGDVIYDTWKEYPFELVSTKDWEGFKVKSYKK